VDLLDQPADYWVTQRFRGNGPAEIARVAMQVREGRRVALDKFEQAMQDRLLTRIAGGEPVRRAAEIFDLAVGLIDVDEVVRHEPELAAGNQRSMYEPERPLRVQ
jgi:hypothetical protein